ncbi:hypothetical protein BDZ91DRAFT_791222 [Kalaharituber pfeilii]|nr:hypothetical protein BDZ91DRAFT_791222 [Kalaharituber pfeilii]
MPAFEPALELLSTGLLPLTVTNTMFMTPTAISLSPSMQRASQFLIFLPPGIGLRGILVSRTISGGVESFLDNVPATLEDQQSDVQNIYTCNCNQPLALVNDPFPHYDKLITSDTIDGSIFDGVSSAIPPPSGSHPQILNSMGECLLKENQKSTEELLSGIIEPRDPGTTFDNQNAQPISNAAVSASQQSQVMFWMSPDIPHDFVPAPSLPDYGIRFEEPVIFATSPPVTR